MRDDNIARFNHGLQGEFEALQKGVTEARNAAQHEMILDEASQQDAVVAYLTEIKARVDSIVAEQQRINCYQREFKVCSLTLWPRRRQQKKRAIARFFCCRSCTHT